MDHEDKKVASDALATYITLYRVVQKLHKVNDTIIL